MTLQDIDKLVASIGLPYAYYAFPKPGKAPPFIVYRSPGRTDLYADNSNYQHILDLDIELYTKTKRYDLEEQIEAVLEAGGLTYSKMESVIDSDGVFMITYSMEVIILNGAE